MADDAIITGIGLVTPLGRGLAHTWSALLSGEFIRDHARVVPVEEKMPGVAALGIEAADEAIKQAAWADTARDAAVICCTSKGSVQDWFNWERSSAVFGLADLSTFIARRFRFIDGPRLTISAACAGGLHGLIRAAMMIKTGEAARVLVVASEASVHPLFLGSFQRLGVLPATGELCRPFDVKRGGFLVSDAAAAVCVEAAPQCDTGLRPVHVGSEVRSAVISDQVQRGPEACVTIERFAMGGDAAHLTASDPDGRVLRHLLRQTIEEYSVDLVHAHGTGTVSNDATELAAIEGALPDNVKPVLVSHKGALGHSLGASGLVAVAINCMCHRTGMIPPNINTINPLPSAKVRISREIERATIHRSIIHAAGFGGPTAVVALRGNGVSPIKRGT